MSNAPLRIELPLPTSSSSPEMVTTNFIGAGIFTGVTVALYPVSVVKTRLQVASKDTVERNAFSVIRGLLKTDGIPGLYRGFGTVITDAIPARIIFLTALETTKVASFKIVEPFKFSEPTQAAIANGIAGMTASLFSQAVFVPIDVVSSSVLYGGLVMVQANVLSGGLVSLALSATMYHQFYRFLGHGTDLKEAAPNPRTIVAVQPAGGIISGATASCVTTPLDTIKTRLQVMGHDKRPSTRNVVKNLIADVGWKGLYRGLGPRFFSMSAWGTSMILAYEHSAYA
ncbi:hypothetical protein DITRI_Ditri13aG0155300 [Diplodiscus trichospermus]